MRLIDGDLLLQKQYRIDDSATLSTRDVVNVEDIEDAPTVCDIDAIRKEIADNHDYYFFAENNKDIALGLEYALDIFDEHQKGSK